MKKLQQRSLAQQLPLLSWILLLLSLLPFLQPAVCRGIALGRVAAAAAAAAAASPAEYCSAGCSNAIGVLFLCDCRDDDGDVVVVAAVPDSDFLEKVKNISLLSGVDDSRRIFCRRRKRRSGGDGFGRSSSDFVFCFGERENDGSVMQCCELRRRMMLMMMMMQQQQESGTVAKCLGNKLRRTPVDECGPDLAAAVGLCCCYHRSGDAVISAASVWIDAVSAGRVWIKALGSRNSDHYIRGFPNPVADKASEAVTTTRQLKLAHVTTEERSVDAVVAVSVKATTQGEKQEFPSAIGLQKSPSLLTPSYIHASPATKSHLSRRSLQARSSGQTTAAVSYWECRRGHLWLGCDWQENQVVGALVCVAGVLMLVIACAHATKDNGTHADFLDSIASLPPRFSYTKLQKSTKNFSRKLGDGAFGSVYEGFLPNGLRVAVKMLDKTSVQGEKQFRAEVASMGAIRHLNLVRLHGFCSEGSHRLLVYEFMANGSLDSWLFGKKHGEKLLDWEQRLNIALGTARALAYLHEECSDHIIHLDVKPENILLDHQFCPKLSDFGLAKLMDKEQSRVVTSMRGTPGYLAPEWLLPQAAVTAKTDVYSFGMVLLELISGRENTNFSLGKEQWYFPAWAFKLVGEGRTMELLDKRLHVEEVEYFHKDNALRAIHTALLCIQDDPSLRPSMSRVVHMLQGHVEPEPLNARQAAIQPPRRLLSAFTASRSDMKADDVQYEPVAPTVPSSGPAVLPQPTPAKLQPSTLQEMDTGTNQGADKMSPLPSSYQGNQSFGNKQTRMVQGHAVDTGQNSIPPWPVKGDVILLRGPGGDLYGVVREVRVQTKQMRLALLHRLGSELRWSVWEEENSWRHWNESVKTLNFWVVVRWSTIPGRGIEKFPVEWMAR